MYTAGIKIYLHLNASGTSNALNTFACFCACAPLVALSSEVFYRIIDVPSVAIAKEFWGWMTK